MFRHQNLSPNLIIDSALTSIRCMIRWVRTKSTHILGSSNSPLTWTELATGVLKINVDSAFVPETRKGVVAFVCRDSNGVLLDGGARSMQVLSVVQTEVMTILQALTHFRFLDNKKIVLESDQKGLVEVISSPAYHTLWEVDAIIKEAPA